MKKNIHILVCLLTALLCFSSCSEEDASSGLVGTWIYSESGFSCKITFKSNNECSYTKDFAAINAYEGGSGTYRISETEVVCQGTNGWKKIGTGKNQQSYSNLSFNITFKYEDGRLYRKNWECTKQ